MNREGHELPEAKPLLEKLQEWIAAEGYPLEYYAAEVFRSAGFDVLQGTYTRHEEGSPREIDLVAQRMVDAGSSFIRVENVVECKWSRDKPWVVFTSPRSRVLRSACIAQTISSLLGDAVLWTLSGHEELMRMQLFDSPAEPGFGGRQGFSKNDTFYAALAAVTSACVSIVKKIDGPIRNYDHLPRACVIALPIVVVDGELFEARYDAAGDKMLIAKENHVRCHWAGSPSWPLRATVDVVTKEGLGNFTRQRVADVDAALPILQQRLIALDKAFAARDPSQVPINSAPTGRGSLPFLLRRFRDLHGSAN
jgi:hypothetical protein